jgi:(p)ppGpp synthase/HD superfamily hydrolase
MVLSSRFEEAFVYAAKAHAGQHRKGSGTPYVAHLIGTAAIALEHGAAEDEAIAALLHDAAEDAGGVARLEDIRGRFGDAVADIVAGCTDSYETPKPPWRERKEKYLAHLPSAPASVRLVSASDKLYNALSILADYQRIGDKLWERFRGGKEGTLWYYRSLADIYAEHGPQPLAEELGYVVGQIERLASVMDA